METKTNDLPVIYGITEQPSGHGLGYGLQAFALDGQTGEVLESHFCSSVGFAKSDLGFTDKPIMDYIAGDRSNEHSTVYFHKKVHETYAKKYPKGYRTEWIGFWKNNNKMVELIERTKTDFDSHRPKLEITF